MKILLLICIIFTVLAFSNATEEEHELDRIFYLYSCPLGACQLFSYSLEKDDLKVLNVPLEDLNPTPSTSSEGSASIGLSSDINLLDNIQAASSSSSSGDGVLSNPQRLIHANLENSSAVFYRWHELDGVAGKALRDIEFITEVDMNKQIAYPLGQAQVAKFIEYCGTPLYHKGENKGLSVIRSLLLNFIFVVETDFTTQQANYTAVSYGLNCPLWAVTEDWSTMYLLANGTGFIELNVQTKNYTNNVQIPDMLHFYAMNNLYENRIVYFNGYLYGVAANINLQTSTATTVIYRINVNSPSLETPWSYSGNYLVGRLSPSYYLPYSMFSSDSSHIIIPITSSKFQLYIFDLDNELDHVVYTPKDTFPTGNDNYYLVYKIKGPYPKGEIFGVTFGYGLTVLLILAFVFYYFYKDQLIELRTTAQDWPLANMSRIANGAMLVVAVLIQMITIYSLAREINKVGLSMIACFMEIHKCIIGIFMSFYYHHKMAPVYYVASFLSCLFNFIAFIVILVPNDHIIVTAKGGIVFFKIVSALITIYSTTYLVFFFKKLRGSDPTKYTPIGSSTATYQDF
ncbi:hypothetical protein DLAC_09097 [Tieghemostelium lacteum]|uniref:Intimal thickness related receptor IRP domain-containing protein n=1 Tax=Tieghemostelium lacteum TaxID=361077 RepID=A0A151Z963_TIELA|nr:hypothetical protein DLAC_09097 [Tieghemostelium lacteum]|eukprot:KYQ90473.1 hypothetical protein DLAC_09097 [Tieghemostelium lacteum]